MANLPYLKLASLSSTTASCTLIVLMGRVGGEVFEQALMDNTWGR